ncbi:putative Ig domain-containing protein [Shewanella sedimentimangrovi]|uniref:Dystroglycan-type cadherin-like domain-containing protein n=1 Tax=Shewanella sedimentimangrovi TaxID=2814293 RepID=A0ABX7R0P9_9GAMM|nr:putative Ig domain-containing protein [Shewanella sedimentimangrovi]QSX37364.1 hypothetical protein JYB85_00440 [Shewanella sedimentimangrovi]
MDFQISQLGRPSILVASLALILSGCGGSDDDKTGTQSQNVAPQITSAAPQQATEDIAFAYQLGVTDPDDANNGTDLSFSLTNAPEGMSISATGLISWTPLEGVLSSGEVTVSVKDGGENGAVAASQTFTLAVTPVNDAPVLSAIASQQLEAGQNISFQLQVTDPDDANNGTDLHFSLANAPEGMSVSATGLISFTSAASSSRVSEVTVMVADGGEDGAAAAAATFSIEEQVFINVDGSLANFFNGEPIANAWVRLLDGSQQVVETQSDTSGNFAMRLQDTALMSRMTLVADGEGFAEAALSLTSQELINNQQLLLQPVHATVSFDASQASELQVEGQTLVSLPAAALVDAQQNPVTTEVSAELTIINPALNINLMPGDMETRGEDGVVRPIESFGAITVTFTDSNGQPLQMAAGKKAEINIPAVSADGGELPETIPLYYFDAVSGLWVEEGSAALTLDAGGQPVYRGEVSHFTTWNADRVYDTVNILGCLQDEQGNAIADAQVMSVGRSYLGRASTFSNEDGTFELPAMMGAEVMVSANSGLQSRTLVVETSNVNLEMLQCLVLSEATSKITLTWGEAPYDLDSHLMLPDGNGGTAHVFYAQSEVLVGDSLIFLDVDDTSSYGPEVITLPTLPTSGRYGYYVHNFSFEVPMVPAQTRVELILNNQRWLFTPETEGALEWWHVFDLKVNEEGVATVEPADQWLDAPDYWLPEAVATPQRVVPLKALDDVVRGLVSAKYYQR